MPRMDARRAALLLLAAAVFLVAPACQKEEGGGQQGRGGERPPTRVVLAEARTERVVDSITLVGTLTQTEMVEISSETPGTIHKIWFEEGERVERNQKLFVLERKKFEARLEQAKADLELARANLARSRQLASGNTISQQKLDEAEAAFTRLKSLVELRKEELDDTVITAPFAGTMGRRLVSRGQYINVGRKLTTLVCLDPIYVDVNVPERYVRRLSEGQVIEFTVDAYPEESYTATVVFTSPQLDEVTRTLLVRSELDNPEGSLKPGMFATIELVLAVRENSLVVPETAVMLQGDQHRVAKVGEDMTVSFVPVETGLLLKGKAEIVQGLAPGDVVISEGHQKVGPDSKVTDPDWKEDDATGTEQAGPGDEKAGQEAPKPTAAAEPSPATPGEAEGSGEPNSEPDPANEMPAQEGGAA